MLSVTLKDGFKDIFGVYFLETISFEYDYDMLTAEILMILPALNVAIRVLRESII
jgi:hypothetical protein